MSRYTILNLIAATAGLAQVFHGVAVAPDGNSAWVVAIDTILVAHTSDFGEHWDYQTVPTIRNMWDVDCTDELTAWTCGMAGDIWHTTDGGLNWFRQNLGGPKHAARIRFFDAAHGWAAGGDMVQLCTTDGGAEWNQKLVPDPPIPSETTEYNGVWFVNERIGWIVAGRWPSGDTFSGGQGYIVMTTDQGDNWQLLKVDTTYDFYDCWFRDSLTGFVVGGDDRTLRGVVLQTTDGGLTWNERPLPASARFLRSICFVSPSEGWACGRSGTIIHTTDAGQTWTLQPTAIDTTLFDIEFANHERGMASGNSIVLRTLDGGATWQPCFGAISEERRLEVGPGLTILVRENPAKSPVRFVVQGYGDYVLTVHDPLGRTCWRSEGTNYGNVQHLSWDGRRPHGPDSTVGVYLVRLSSAGSVRTTRFVLLH